MFLEPKKVISELCLLSVWWSTGQHNWADFNEIYYLCIFSDIKVFSKVCLILQNLACYEFKTQNFDFPEIIYKDLMKFG